MRGGGSGAGWGFAPRFNGLRAAWRAWRGRRGWAMRGGATWGLVLAWIVAVGGLVVAREGNLAWDDADYLRRGLRIAHQAVARGGLRAVAALVQERPKPPWLAGWVALGRWALGPRRFWPLLLWASVGPAALLAVTVVVVARRLGGPGAGWFALLAWAGSPLMSVFAAKVMVETFMGLWVLLVVWAAAAVLERPTPARAVGLGGALAGALLTKLTAALLLPGPAVYVFWAFARRYPRDRAAWRLAAAVLIPVLGLAGPWYFKNGRDAVAFALFSARYDVLALGAPDSSARGLRLVALAREIVGGPLGATLAVAGVWRWAGRAGGWPPAATDFARLALSGAGTGALILLVPSYFEPRFLLPVWPALAVVAGLVLRDAVAGRPGRAGPTLNLALGACVLVALTALVREGRTKTYWDARGLLDQLGKVHRCRTIANLGNCGDWNVCKTGLINELRADPSSCFVLHDLSNVPASEQLLRRFDAIVVLDQDRLPGGVLESSGLNRRYCEVLRCLGRCPFFCRVAPVAGDLPPLLVFVRCDASGPAPPGAGGLGRMNGSSRGETSVSSRKTRQ